MVSINTANMATATLIHLVSAAKLNRLFMPEKIKKIMDIPLVVSVQIVLDIMYIIQN